MIPRLADRFPLCHFVTFWWFGCFYLLKGQFCFRFGILCQAPLFLWSQFAVDLYTFGSNLHCSYAVSLMYLAVWRVILSIEQRLEHIFCSEYLFQCMISLVKALLWI